MPIIEQQVGDTFEDGAAAIISEYPGLLPGGRKNIDAATIPEAIAFDNVRSTKTGGAKALDLGHRHWSSLHWLYPGTMLPFQLSAINDIKDKRFLYKAAHNTLLMKLRAGGGHTGWSAVWGAALFARLMDAEGAYRLLGRAIQLYTAPNLMGLHPSLAPRPINECETCFYDPCVSFDKSLDDFLTDGVNESMIDPYLRFKKPTPQRKVPPKVAPTLPHKNPSEVSRKLLFEHAADLTTKYPDSRWPDSIDSIASLQLQRRSGRANKLLGRTSAVSSNRWVDNEFFGKGISGKMLEVANLRGKTTRIINPELHFKESDVTGPLKLERGMNTIDDAKVLFISVKCFYSLK